MKLGELVDTMTFLITNEGKKYWRAGKSDPHANKHEWRQQPWSELWFQQTQGHWFHLFLQGAAELV